MGIPSAVLTTFIFMYFNDMSLNIISLSAIITVLGMLVDDAIVVSENIYYHKLAGHSSHKAGYIGLIEVANPIVMSILTTIVAFLPLLAIKGKMGMFIYVFPIIVSVALAASLFEALFLLPQHLTHNNEAKDKIKVKKSNWFDPVMNLYKTVLKKILTFRYLVLFLFITVFIITALFSVNYFKKFVLIQDDSSDSFMINLEAPVGTKLEVTSEMTKNFEKKIIDKINKKSLYAVRTVVGHHRVKLTNDRGNREDWSQVAIYLSPVSERKEKTEDIIKELNQFIKKEGKFGFDKIFFEKYVLGPDPGKGVEVKLAGNNLSKIESAVDELKEFIAKIEGVTDVDTTNKPGKEEIVLSFNHLEMARLNIDIETVAKTIKTAFSGIIVTSFQTETKKIDYRLELKEDFTRDIRFLKKLLIPNKQERLIELSNIANFKIKSGISYIDHYNGDRAVIITANINNKITTSKTAMSMIKQKYKSIADKYQGVYLVGGGEAAETESSLQDLFFAFILALIAVYTILIIQFKNPIQPFLIVSVIPLGIVGALLSFMAHKVQLSFMGMVGLIGLSGIVVNDSIVMVEFINNILKERKNEKKINYIELISEGAKRRLRPILLTTLTTVGGLLPTVYGIGGKVDSIVPTSMAIAYGLLFATFVTLFFLPSLYLIIIDIGALKTKIVRILKKNRTLYIFFVVISIIIAGLILFKTVNVLNDKKIINIEGIISKNNSNVKELTKQK